VRAEERRRLAVEAATGVAASLGLVADHPRVLKDSNNTIVHLAPAPVVAKVGTSHFRDVELESLERELAVAAFLAERDAPVVAPTGDVAAGPHRWGNLTLTLWQYAESVRGAALDPVEVAATLSAVHRALLELPCALPTFSVELEDASHLLQRDRSPALAAADRSFLLSAVDDLRVTLSGLATEMRPLHGSPHAGNWLRTAEGLLLLDFETACRGPIEWDLAALDDAVAHRFGNVDRELLGVLRWTRSACVAVKCWVEPSRAPEVFEAAHFHLKLLRGQPLD
jgi:Phosphotransferase enzyme family